jgi:hypothetical protein
VQQITENQVEGDGRPGMAKVRIAINGWSANVHAGKWWVDRFKKFLSARKRIVNKKLVFHRMVNSNAKVEIF